MSSRSFVSDSGLHPSPRLTRLSSVSLARHALHYRAADYSLPGQAMILMDHPCSTGNHCQVTLTFSVAIPSAFNLRFPSFSLLLSVFRIPHSEFRLKNFLYLYALRLMPFALRPMPPAPFPIVPRPSSRLLSLSLSNLLIFSVSIFLPSVFRIPHSTFRLHSIPTTSENSSSRNTDNGGSSSRLLPAS